MSHVGHSLWPFKCSITIVVSVYAFKVFTLSGTVHLTFPHRSTGWKSGVEMEVWKSGVEIFFTPLVGNFIETPWNQLKASWHIQIIQGNLEIKVVIWASNSFTPITNQFPTSGVEKNFHTGFPHLHFHTKVIFMWFWTFPDYRRVSRLSAHFQIVGALPDCWLRFFVPTI